MHPLRHAFRSLGVLLHLQSDLLFYGAALGAALLSTGFLLTL